MSPAAPIQSLSVPTHSESTTSPPHTVYTIRITTPAQTYSLPTRYSALLSLHQSLQALPGASHHPLPPFPQKRSSFFSLTSHLSPEETLARRLALETYLRTILSSRDNFYSTSKPFIDFLAPPASLTPSKPALSSTTWLDLHTKLQTQARNLTSSFSKRDSLLSSPATSAQAHTINASAKKELVEFLTQLEDLRAGLKELENGGMVQGECARRWEMVRALEEKGEVLGVMSGRRVVVKQSPKDEQDARTPAKDALLGAAKPAGRALGAAAKGKETATTRALDNQGLLQLQQQYMDDQDGKLEELTAAIRRQRGLGEMIGEELEVQKETMDQLEHGIDRTTKNLKNAQVMARRLG
ncbi:hypothetical protein MNV49_003448 [Pseudohyphozyma bogoriensis]|nr:hypothetical protein MNV49_003448 [Pseudohyphozyma bogoriensis]